MASLIPLFTALVEVWLLADAVAGLLRAHINKPTEITADMMKSIKKHL